ncbi:energy-coupled thiamine transporter ThiT [Pseudolactococcus insecticola]|uniref:Thiamine transporter ThiT n=1 Tax=Pseudolactococcus insecticola TaxID=2709158 RepID=A0A6A0B578_9LACT|nr:energy-coupled thiamine transporter ThiT [Lactococcus insecticola]GFH40559.1 hypothetical protein Hs20B_09570 [Lactococcus insecticola]
MLSSNSQTLNVRALAETAIAAALCMALSFIPTQIGWFEISLGMIVLTIFSLRRGLVLGLSAGLIWGLLHFILGKVYFLSVPQVLIEYVLAFTAGGIAGVFKPWVKSTSVGLIVVSAFAASIFRYFFHFIAGVIFWSDYAWKGWGAVAYSLVINGTSGLLTAIVSAIIAVFVIKAYPKILNP